LIRPAQIGIVVTATQIGYALGLVSIALLGDLIDVGQAVLSTLALIVVGLARRASFSWRERLSPPSSVADDHGDEAGQERQDEQDIEPVMARSMVQTSLLRAAHPRAPPAPGLSLI
jgi:hypothetical protein